MSDTDRLARIADTELQLTEKALDDIRREAQEQASAAKDPESAFRVLQMVRCVDEIRRRLRSYRQTRDMDAAAQATRQAED